MSIATKSGDNGTTALMYGRRVSKSHPRVEAYGCVDELNSSLGLVRATADIAWVREEILSIQKDLIVLMGELATGIDDLERYVRDGFSLVTPDMTTKLDRGVHRIEAQQRTARGWAMPGGNLHSASLDVARTVCRRAERHVCALQEHDQLRNPEIIVYLNRLSDLLWLIARFVEQPTAGNALV